MTKLSDYESMMINLLGIDREKYERSKMIRESFQPVIYEKRKDYDLDTPGKKARRNNVKVLVSNSK